MPHELLHLSWAEWAAIIAIVSGVFVGFDHILKSFKDSIMGPLGEQMKNLSRSIDKLTESSVNLHRSSNYCCFSILFNRK